MAAPVKRQGTFGRGSIARNALAFVAAYLLVLQTVLTGVAAQEMHARSGLATEVICLNSETDASDTSDHASAFACCGVGCLVGSQALDGPSAPDQRLTYPAARAYEPPAAAEIREARPRLTEGSGPRAPPAIG